MTDVLGSDPELDAERLQTAEHPLVVLGHGCEAGSQRRELAGQPHTLPQAAPKLLRRVVRHYGSACADHRRIPYPGAKRAILPSVLRYNGDPYRTAQDAQRRDARALTGNRTGLHIACAVCAVCACGGRRKEGGGNRISRHIVRGAVGPSTGGRTALSAAPGCLVSCPEPRAR